MGVKPVKVERNNKFSFRNECKIKAYQDLVDWFCPLISLPDGWEGTKKFGKLDNQFPKSLDDQLRKEKPVTFLHFAPKRNYNFPPLLLLAAL